MKVSLKQIKRDHKLSPREKTLPELAQDYAEIFDQLPPIEVYKTPDEDKYLLVDGWHRYRAAEINKLGEVEAQVYYGSRQEAEARALLANLKHGKPLTCKEKRHVIEKFLKLYPERTNSWLAKDLGVSVTTVTKVRAELEANFQIGSYEYLYDKDNKKYPCHIEQPKKEVPEEGRGEAASDGGEEKIEPDQKAQELVPEPELPPPPMLGPYLLNKAHQADCLMALGNLPESCLDLVFADPPYNIGMRYGKSLSNRDKLIQDDYFNWCMQWFLAIFRVLKPGGAFYVMHYPEVAARWTQQLNGILTFQHWMSWVYNSNIGHSVNSWRRSHRAILYYTKGKPAFFNGEADPQPYQNPDDPRVAHLGKEGTTPYDWWYYDLVKNVSQDKTERPNQLPVDLVRRVVLTSCPQDGIVCDPFMGSGTTAVAAAKAGRDWIGFDIESGACNTTGGRLK